MKDRPTEKVAYLSYTENRLQPEQKPLVREMAWTSCPTWREWIIS